jgi:hypothetical protein
LIVCTKCGELKPLESFTKRAERPKGHHSWCKKCVNLDRKKAYRERNPEAVKDQKLKATFGINLEDYNNMLLAQGNVCAICKKEESVISVNGSTKALAVDHCHTTGKVRGLLCQKCNQAIGLFNDDLEKLNSAISYIRRVCDDT